MAKSALKSLLGVVVGIGALSAVSTGTAEAAVLNYAFEVKIDQGPYAGVHKGAFQFDDATLVACGTNPDYQCATPSTGLKLLFNFMGTAYNQTSDVDYQAPDTSQFPAVYYIPEWEPYGLPYVLSLIVMPPKAAPSFSIIGTQFFMGFDSVPQANDPSDLLGSVSYFRLPDSKPGDPSPCQKSPESCNPAAVPEPSEIAGTAIAAGVLGAFWRSRRVRKPSQVNGLQASSSK